MNKTTNINELILSFRRCYNVYLHRVSNSGQIIHLEALSSKFIDKVNNWIRHRGELEAIRRIKFIRHQVHLFLADCGPIKTSRYPIYKDGLPKDLGPWAAYALRSGDHDTIRDILTLLQVSYIIPKWQEPDYSEIERSSAPDHDLIKDIAEFAKNQQFVKFDVPDLYWNEPHPTTKMGPNGAAMVTSSDDLFALTDSLIENLKELGGFRFGTYMDNLIGARDYLLKIRKTLFPVKEDRDPSREIQLGRISIVKSPEGKSRIIAIVDYWSQSVLKPLHNWAFAQLRKFPADRTFNQNAISPPSPVGAYYSFDLKMATDRFPVSLQESILAVFVGEKKASAWRSIMVDRPFQRHDRKGSIRYLAGQPMGAYSSWAMFTLSHHFIVQYAAKQTGHTGMFTSYLLLGDDIVIYDQEVAHSYSRIINRLDVEIQSEKSLVSKDTFEFAKRLFHKGREMTPFPMSAIVANHKSVSALWSVTILSKERGFDRLNSFAIPGFVKAVQSSCEVNLRSTKHIAKYYEAFHVLSRHGNDSSLLQWSLQTIHRAMNRDRPCRSNLILEKQELLWDLGYFVMSYKASLVDNAFKQFNQLSFQITGQDWAKGGIEGMCSQQTAPIDLMRIPIVWVSRLMADHQRRDIETLKYYNQMQQFEIFLTLAVNPIGDITRLMSHQVNTTALSRHDAMMKSIRTRQKHLNHLIEEAYQAPQEIICRDAGSMESMTGDKSDPTIPNGSVPTM